MTLWEMTAGNTKTYTETAQIIECWEQGSGIKATLRRKTPEDQEKVIKVFMHRFHTKNKDWWLFTSLEYKTKKVAF